MVYGMQQISDILCTRFPLFDSAIAHQRGGKMQQLFLLLYCPLSCLHTENDEKCVALYSCCYCWWYGEHSFKQDKKVSSFRNSIRVQPSSLEHGKKVSFQRILSSVETRFLEPFSFSHVFLSTTSSFTCSLAKSQ